MKQTEYAIKYVTKDFIYEGYKFSMKQNFNEALRTVHRYNFTTTECTDQIYMVQNNGRVIVAYTGTKQNKTNEVSHLQEKQEKQGKQTEICQTYV